MNKSTIVIGGLAVLALLGVVFLFVNQQGVLAGAVPSGPVHYQGETFQGGLQIGQRGTFVTNVLSGTCNLSQSSAGSHAATTSKEYFCSVPGVQAGDLVLADLPPGAGLNSSGAASLFGGFSIVSAYATTSNAIGVVLDNFTGAATSSFAQATTTVEYRVIH